MASFWDVVANWVQVPSLQVPSLPTGLSTSLQQRITKFLLRSVVGRFVQGGGDLNLVEGAEGDTVLTDLKLSTESINALLPDAVPQLESGSVAQVTLRLPWSSLYNGAIHVHIKGMQLSTAIRPEKMDEATLYTSAMRASENLSELEESITQLAAEAIHADPDGRDLERSLSLEEGRQLPMSGAWTEGTRESSAGRVAFGAVTRTLLRRLQVSVEDVRVSLAFGNEQIHVSLPHMSLNTEMGDPVRSREEQASLEDALCTLNIRGLLIELETPEPQGDLALPRSGPDTSKLDALASTYKSVYQSADLPPPRGTQPYICKIAACGNEPISIRLEAKKSSATENTLSMDVRMPACMLAMGPESLAAMTRLYGSLNTLGTALKKPSSLPERQVLLPLSVHLGKIQIVCLYEKDRDNGLRTDPMDAPLSGQHIWLEASDTAFAMGSDSVEGSIDHLGIYERSPKSTSPVLIFRHVFDTGVQDPSENKSPLGEATFEDPWQTKDATELSAPHPVISFHWDRRLPPQVNVRPIQFCAETSTLERLLMLWRTVISSGYLGEEESDTSSFSEGTDPPSWPALDVHVEHVWIALKVQRMKGHARSGSFSFVLHHILCEIGHREAQAKHHVCLLRLAVHEVAAMHIPNGESIGDIFFKLSDSAKHGRSRLALSLSLLARPSPGDEWQLFSHVLLGELGISLNRRITFALQYLAEDAMQLAARWKERFVGDQGTYEVPERQNTRRTEPYPVLSMDVHRIQVHMMLPGSDRYLCARANLLSLGLELDERKAWSLHLSTQFLTLDEPKAQLTYFNDNGTRNRDAPTLRLDLAPESQRGATGPRLFLNLTGCMMHLLPDRTLWQDAAQLFQVPEGVFADMAPAELTRVTCVVRDLKCTVQVPGDDTQAIISADAVSLLYELAASGRKTVSLQLSEAVTKLFNVAAAEALPWELLTTRNVRATLVCDGGEHPTMDLNVSRSRLHLRLSAATCETVHRLAAAAQEHLTEVQTPGQVAISRSDDAPQDTKADVLQDIDEDAFCEPLATSLEEITERTRSSSCMMSKPSEESSSLDAFPYVVAEGGPLLKSDNVSVHILNGSSMTPTLRKVQAQVRKDKPAAALYSIHTEDTRVSLELFDDQSAATVPLVQAQADGVEVKFSALEAASPVAARTQIKVQELEIFDKLPTSTWNKFLTRSLETPVPQHWRAPMVSVLLQHMRSTHGIEVRLKVKLAPLRMFVDQDTLDFLEQFGLKATASMRDSQAPANDVRPQPFVQYAEVHPVHLVLDYKPKRVNYTRIQQGSSMELLNLFNFEASAMVLRHVTFYGVDGWTQLFYALDAVWSPDVKANQLADIVSGVTPVQTLVNFGAGLTNLVLLPFEQYERDQSLVRGLRRGTTGLVYSTALETVKLGVKLSTGTQVLLERAENMLGGHLPGPIRTEVLGENGAAPAPSFSKRAQPPENFWDGARQARSGFSRGLHDASDTILAVPTSVTEPGEDGRPRTLVRAVPIALLQGASGATEATSRLFMGMQTALDPRAPSRSRIKYKPPGEE